MTTYFDTLPKDELEEVLSGLEHEADAIRKKNLHLDMTRGKPNSDQVKLSLGLFDTLDSDSDFVYEGQDCANYGTPQGISEIRDLGAQLLGIDQDLVIASGSSSLNLMFDCVAAGFVQGIANMPAQAYVQDRKWICLAPGYDRHFAITKYFGYENIAVKMDETGPDMDTIERLVQEDPSIKGIWCVPKYSNPTGITYTEKQVMRFAHLKPAAPDFRIYWDNAYCVHDLYATPDELANIFDYLGPEQNLVYEFASTSKITVPGAGVGFVGASQADIEIISQALDTSRVCSDKCNQLAHIKFLQDLPHIYKHMEKQAELIRPKFEIVQKKLEDGLAGFNCGRWTKPRGGYFISFDGPLHSAGQIVDLAASLGLNLTQAGSTWPDGFDPYDTNIRIAPTYPCEKDLELAMDIFVLSVKIVAARHAREK